MNRAALSALWSFWRRNPLQLFTLVAGLALATALWSGVQAINAEARASYDAAAATLGEGQFDQLVPRAGDTIPQATFVTLRRAGWLVSPVLEGRLRSGDTSVRIVGVDPLTAPGGLGPVTLNEDIDLGAFLQDNVVFADPGTARALEDQPDLRIIVDADVAPGTALTDIGVAQRLLDQPGRISRLMLSPDQPLSRADLGTLAPDLARQPAQGGSDIARLTDSFHLNLTAFGLLSFAVGIFIVHGAIGLAFEQRRAMLRTLRALGLPLRRIVLLLAAELAVVALIAGGLGVALGYLIAASLLPDVAATIAGLYGAQVADTLALRPEWWLSGLGIALGGAALAGTGALIRIARMPLLSSARARAWAVASRRGRRGQGLVALTLLLAAGALAIWGDGLVAGFALLGGLLVGAALALPLSLALGQKAARRVTAQWFWADTRQQLPGISLALMALLLAMAANVGVSTMVSSFRTTFTSFLDQRLSSELYITASSPDQTAALLAFLGPRTREILPVIWVNTTLAGLDADLYGARIGATYKGNWRFLDAAPEVWENVATGRAVIVNEQLARRSGLWLGDDLSIAPATTLPIAGVFGDYGNPKGQAIVGEALFATLFPDAIATRFGLRTDTPDALSTALRDEYGLPEGNIIDQAGIKAFSLSVFERTFAVTAALNVLTLSVAGFAILMSLLTLSAMRLPQLAPVWALGLTRAAISQLELLRPLVLAALTAICALPLGLALAWVLLSIVNVQAFGWKLPMYLFPGDYARLGVLALLAALLAAAWPAWRLRRTPPGDLLKVFANER